MKLFNRMKARKTRIHWLSPIEPAPGAKEINRRIRLSQEAMRWWYR